MVVGDLQLDRPAVVDPRVDARSIVSHPDGLNARDLNPSGFGRPDPAGDLRPTDHILRPVKVWRGERGRHEAEYDTDDAFKHLADEEHPQAAAHLPTLCGPIGEDAAERAEDEIAEAKDRAKEAGRRLCQGEEFLKVLNGDVGDCQLDAKAKAVGEGEDPSVDIRAANLNDHIGLRLLLRALCFKHCVIAVREVAPREDERR